MIGLTVNRGRNLRAGLMIRRAWDTVACLWHGRMLTNSPPKDPATIIVGPGTIPPSARPCQLLDSPPMAQVASEQDRARKRVILVCSHCGANAHIDNYLTNILCDMAAGADLVYDSEQDAFAVAGGEMTIPYRVPANMVSRLKAWGLVREIHRGPFPTGLYELTLDGEAIASTESLLMRVLIAEAKADAQKQKGNADEGCFARH